MVEPFYQVLFCDDNTQFAYDQVEALSRKLKVLCGMDAECIRITPMTSLATIQDMLKEGGDISRYNLVFCDLGWSHLTLKGVQLLHDIQMRDPRIHTVLFTAQSEDAVIQQALQWQFDFIDQIIRVDGHSYFEEMVQVILREYRKKVMRFVTSCGASQEACRRLEMFLRAKCGDGPHWDEISSQCRDVNPGGYAFLDLFPECRQMLLHRGKLSAEKFRKKKEYLEELIDRLSSEENPSAMTLLGSHLLPADQRKSFRERALVKLESVKKEMNSLFEMDLPPDIALDVTFSRSFVQVKLKSDPAAQTIKRHLELVEKIERFPQIEWSDLVALNKASYFAFIKNKYGGFPQMAKETGLDLNNIYRVNRRFKGSPIVVFQFSTIKEIVGIYDEMMSVKTIQELLATKELIYEVMNSPVLVE